MQPQNNKIYDALKKKGTISYEEFVDNMEHIPPSSKAIKVKYTCRYCKKEKIDFVVKFCRNKTGEDICGRCVKTIKQFHTPVELLQYDDTNPVPYEVFLKYKDSYHCKKLVKITCKECGEESIVRWDKMTGRMYFTDEPFCHDCLTRIVPKLEECRKINSQAQYIAQNRPEVKKRQRESQIALMKQGFSQYVNIRSMTFKNRLIGICDGIGFCGSFELAFIAFAKDNGWDIERCNDIIEYQYENITRYYQPDFAVDTGGKKLLVEVKGYKNKFVQAKEDAAREYVKQEDNDYDEYWMFDEVELVKYNLPQIRSTKALNKLHPKHSIEIINFPKKWQNIKGCVFTCSSQKSIA